MDVETAVSEFGDLLGEQLDAMHRVAEDDRLVDGKLGEQGVEAVNLLPLLDKCIVLRDTLQGELLHQVDDVRLFQELFLELLHRHRERGGVQANLPRRREVAQQFLNHRLELGAQELVRLVHHGDVAVAQLANTLLSQVEDTARGRHHHMNGGSQTHNIVPQRRPTRTHHHLHAHVLPKFLAHLARLQCQFTRGNQ